MSETTDAGVGLAPEDAALGTRALTRSFGALVAVDAVDLSVPEGELRAIIGPNGAGKTTLFNLITHSIPPTSGTVWLGGRDVTALPEERRPHIGLARSFQSNQLFTELTSLENVRVVAQAARSGPFSLALLGRGKSVAVEEAHALLERIGLDGKAEVEASNLSHGDQRRLGIAMALATDPDVLLLDEPTSNLDPRNTAVIEEAVAAARDRGIGVVIATHDMQQAERIADSVAVLLDGTVIEQGPADELFESPSDDRARAFIDGELVY